MGSSMIVKTCGKYSRTRCLMCHCRYNFSIFFSFHSYSFKERQAKPTCVFHIVTETIKRKTKFTPVHTDSRPGGATKARKLQGDTHTPAYRQFSGEICFYKPQPTFCCALTPAKINFIYVFYSIVVFKQRISPQRTRDTTLFNHELKHPFRRQILFPA